MSIHCQSDVNLMPIRRKSHTNSCRSIANLIPIHRRPYNNRLPIRLQFSANPVPIQGQPPHTTRRPFHRQSNPTPRFNVKQGNAMPNHRQSTNPKTIRCKSDNLVSIQNQSDTKPIHQSHSNHDPINQSITSSLHIRESINYQPIPAEPNIPPHSEDTLIVHFSTQSATPCQYRKNPYGHRLALNRQRSIGNQSVRTNRK